MSDHFLTGSPQIPGPLKIQAFGLTLDIVLTGLSNFRLG